MMRYLSRCIWISILSLWAGMRVAAEPIPEYEMKAAYIYNFATFTTWPAKHDNDITLCILGNDSFGGALDGISGKSASGIRLSLVFLPNLTAVKKCQILFVDASERNNATEIVKQVEKYAILTVTDNPELYQAGIMIGMFLENNRLAFEVNYEAAQHVNLSISSQLLRVARKVR